MNKQWLAHVCTKLCKMNPFKKIGLCHEQDHLSELHVSDREQKCTFGDPFFMVLRSQCSWYNWLSCYRYRAETEAPYFAPWSKILTAFWAALEYLALSTDASARVSTTERPAGGFVVLNTCSGTAWLPSSDKPRKEYHQAKLLSLRWRGHIAQWTGKWLPSQLGAKRSIRFTDLGCFGRSLPLTNHLLSFIKLVQWIKQYQTRNRDNWEEMEGAWQITSLSLKAVSNP